MKLEPMRLLKIFFFMSEVCIFGEIVARQVIRYQKTNSTTCTLIIYVYNRSEHMCSGRVTALPIVAFVLVLLIQDLKYIHIKLRIG